MSRWILGLLLGALLAGLLVTPTWALAQGSGYVASDEERAGKALQVAQLETNPAPETQAPEEQAVEPAYQAPKWETREGVEAAAKWHYGHVKDNSISVDTVVARRIVAGEVVVKRIGGTEVLLGRGGKVLGRRQDKGGRRRYVLTPAMSQKVQSWITEAIRKANAYTDRKVSSAVKTANGYTDIRFNSLESRVAALEGSSKASAPAAAAPTSGGGWAIFGWPWWYWLIILVILAMVAVIYFKSRMGEEEEEPVLN